MQPAPLEDTCITPSVLVACRCSITEALGRLSFRALETKSLVKAMWCGPTTQCSLLRRCRLALGLRTRDIINVVVAIEALAALGGTTLKSQVLRRPSVGVLQHRCPTAASGSVFSGIKPSLKAPLSILCNKLPTPWLLRMA